MEINKICCIGAGYVGGPTMAVMALKCPHINFTVVDLNQEKINLWNHENVEKIPVYEPGLSEIVAKVRNKNLFYSTEIESAIIDSQMIFIAVGTPTKIYGTGKGMASDLTYVEQCARTIAEVSFSDKIIVEKSTLPVRTADTLKSVLTTNENCNFDIISNPEFLAEGTAVKDMLNPDRILIGGEETIRGKKAIKSLVDIYSNWIPNNKILTTNLWSSELSKLVANAFLAQRISSINSISALCEQTEADVKEVAKAIGSDSRIGNKFLNSSVGFGGSCFKKDVLNLVYICKKYGLNQVADYWMSVIEMNQYQRSRFTKKIISSLFDNVNQKILTIFGWSFKKDTNDSRESASIYVSSQLLEEGAFLKVYDPKVSSNSILFDLKILFEAKNYSQKEIQKILKRVEVMNEPYEAVVSSHAIAILTEWDEFKNLDYHRIYNLMEKPSHVFDGRKILCKETIENIGFNFFEIGS